MSDGTTVGHWAMDPCTVYAGRGGGSAAMGDVPIGDRGWLGNPYKTESAGGDHTRGEAVKAFREDFEQRLRDNGAFRDAVEGLSGEMLGCWCHRAGEDEPVCHADVIAEWADLLAAREEP